MPSIASHFSVAKKVGNILNINSDEFMLGNILPDIIKDDNSHFKYKGEVYLIPDIDLFLNNHSFSGDLLIGYLTHLLLDKYFLEEYIPNNILEYKEINLFTQDKIYEDYTRINYTLIKTFSLDVPYINKLLCDVNYNLDVDKLNRNINSINSKVIKNTKYINIDSFIEFLNDISIIIADDIKKLLK